MPMKSFLIPIPSWRGNPHDHYPLAEESVAGMWGGCGLKHCQITSLQVSHSSCPECVRKDPARKRADRGVPRFNESEESVREEIGTEGQAVSVFRADAEMAHMVCAFHRERPAEAAPQSIRTRRNAAIRVKPGAGRCQPPCVCRPAASRRAGAARRCRSTSQTGR